jgi:hypothetical protein
MVKKNQFLESKSNEFTISTGGVSHQKKISICREIIIGLIFLEIPTEKFTELKKKYGGVYNLHSFVQNQISGY